MILYFIITFIGACLLGAIVCGVISFLSDGDAKPLTHVIAFILSVSLAMSGAVLYINKSQSGIRLKKEYTSEYHGGIKRELLEMTMQDYFTEEVNPLMLRELFLTAHKAGQESTKGKIR